MMKNQCATWEVVRDSALYSQKQVTAKLTKPWRRRLAQGKLSYRVALKMARIGVPDHHVIPYWAWRNPDIFMAWHYWRKMPGMHTMKRSQCLELMKLHDDLRAIIDIAKNLGVRVPTNLEGYKRFDRDAHTPSSLLYAAIYERQREQAEICYFEEMPVLPPLEHPEFVEAKVLWKRDDIRAEGQEMEHCVGLYAGHDAFIATVKRGDERATLMVTKDGYASQCFGKRNATTPLSTEIYDKWFPVLKELVASTQPTINHPGKPDYSQLAY
jgi:hypothetical protein